MNYIKNNIIMRTPNPPMELATTLNFSADDGVDGDGGDDAGTKSPEGGNVGVSTVVDDGPLAAGDVAGEILGAFFGDGDETGEILGAIFGVGAETGGDDADGGTAGGGEAVASVLTSSFIPEAQCPLVPHMKYLLPVEDKGMIVIPPPFVDIEFVV